MNLTLNQKVTVISADGSAITAGTIEAFPTLAGSRGPVDAVKVREAGINLIIALPASVRPWRAGDPEPQERLYVDPPRAVRNVTPHNPYMAISADDSDRYRSDRRNLTAPAPAPAPAKDLGDLLKDITDTDLN